MLLESFSNFFLIKRLHVKNVTKNNRKFHVIRQDKNHSPNAIILADTYYKEKIQNFKICWRTIILADTYYIYLSNQS